MRSEGGADRGAGGTGGAGAKEDFDGLGWLEVEMLVSVYNELGPEARRAIVLTVFSMAEMPPPPFVAEDMLEEAGLIYALRIAWARNDARSRLLSRPEPYGWFARVSEQARYDAGSRDGDESA